MIRLACRLEPLQGSSQRLAPGLSSPASSRRRPSSRPGGVRPGGLGLPSPPAASSNTLPMLLPAEVAGTGLEGKSFVRLEATSGFEPLNRGFADLPLRPLGYVASDARRRGSAPAEHGSARWLAAPRGFEPRLTDPKSAVLPLDEGAAAVGGGWLSMRGIGAEDGTRTRDPHLGKVMLYQLSHFRPVPRPPTGIDGAESQDRTGDTAIFSRVLYQLSYLGPKTDQGWSPVGGGEDTTGLPSPSTNGGHAQSRPDRACVSAGSRGCSPVSWRRRLIRSTIGGWVDMRPAERASNFLIGFVK